MAFDGLLINCLVEELNVLIGGKISKIHQLSNNIILTIRSNQQNYKLLISASSSYTRMNITKHSYDAPKSPPSFCMFLRKHLESGIIKNISQHQNDRIIEIEILKLNELKDQVIKLLRFEAMGKHSNIILTENNKILEAVKHLPPFMNSYRTILPGSEYIYPPNDKLNPKISFTYSDFDSIMKYQGISPLLADQILNKNIDIFNFKITPTIVKGKKDLYHVIDLDVEGTKEYYNSVNELLDAFYYNRDTFDKIKQQTKDLTLFIKHELKKNINKLDKLNYQLTTAENNSILKIQGELLLANIYNFKKGMSEVTVNNYYTDQPITIPLNSQLTPKENSQKYFTKHKKIKKSITHLISQIELTKINIEYFDLLNEQIYQSSILDIDEIRLELEEKKYLRSKGKRKNSKPNFITYETADKTLILVGKNNKQNEYITHKTASKNDLWFHTKGIPGSHVIVKSNNPSEDTIRTAATVAAYYSKARYSSSVPVDYTFVKFLKKVPKKALSFVTITNQKTIYIDPDEHFIMNLKKV